MSPDEAAVAAKAESVDLELVGPVPGRGYDFLDKQTGRHVTSLGRAPASWTLERARLYLEREEWRVDRDVYGDLEAIASQRKWILVCVDQGQTFEVRDGGGQTLVQHTYRGVGDWLRAQGSSNG